MKYYALIYDTVDDMITRRAPFREAHLQLIRDWHERGVLFMAGALGDPPDGALIVIRADSPQAAEAFARQDPYVVNGLIPRWTVRPWNVVAGP